MSEADNKIKTILSWIILFNVGLFAVAVNAQVEKTWTDHYWTGADGIKFHYVELGEGAPLILIHGFGSSAVGNWFNTRIAQKLALTNRVIAIDMRGHGETPRQPEGSRGAMVQDVVDLMDYLQIEKAHIGGYSMGGAATVGLLKYAPERFITASILGAGIPESEGWVKGSSRGTDLENNNRMQASIDLTQIHFPVLAINGGDDRADIRGQELEQGLADLTNVVIPNANHMQTPHDPAFADAFANFIAAHNPE